MKTIAATGLVLGALSVAVPPVRAAAPAQDDLSLALAMAERARTACAARGYAVTATFVSLDGQAKVVLRSDNAPIHSLQNSFNKAYTIMTLGALMGAETMTALSAAYRDQSAKTYALAPEPLPHISFSPGSVLVRHEGRVVGGLGVSGSKNGDIDESCAKVGAGLAP